MLQERLESHREVSLSSMSKPPHGETVKAFILPMQDSRLIPEGPELRILFPVRASFRWVRFIDMGSKAHMRTPLNGREPSVTFKTDAAKVDKFMTGGI